MRIPRLFWSATQLFGLLAALLQIFGIGSIFLAIERLNQLAAQNSAAEISVTPLWLAAGMLLAVEGVLIWFFLLRAAEERKYPFSPFDILTAEYELLVLPNEIHTITRLNLRAKREGVRFFEGRNWWSGLSKPEVRIHEPAGATLSPSGMQAPWTYYLVVFPRVLKQDEEIVVETNEVVPREAFERYISKQIVERMERLELRVRLADGSSLRSVDRYKRQTSTEGRIVKRLNLKSEPGTDTVLHTWSIERPRRGLAYQLAYTVR
jgi:hypothetical protein